MKNTFLRGLTARISTLLVAALTLTLLPATTAFAASIFQVDDAVGTVGTDLAPLEIEYTVDTAQQTWADGDMLSIDITNVLTNWDDLTFTVEYDSDVDNEGDVSETAIIAGVDDGQYALQNMNSRLTVNWDVSTWGAVVNGASTIRVVVTAGAIPQYATTATIQFYSDTDAGGDTEFFGSISGASDSIVISAADAAATVTLGGNSFVGSSGDTTLNITLPINLAATDTIAFTMPVNLNVASAAFSSETFAGAGTFTSCTPVGQVITCTAGGAITAGTGTIVLSGITSKYAASSQTVTSVVVKNVASFTNLNIATDSSGALTDTTLGNSTRNANVENMTNVTLANGDTGVVITWTPPVGDNSTHVDILRAKGDAIISGTQYARVDKALGKYIDTDVEDGEKVRYILRTTDGNGNYGENSTEISLTVDLSNSVVAEEEADEEEVDEEDQVEIVEDTPAVEEEPLIEPATPTLPDLEGHWSKDVVLNMVERGIIKGNDDGTFKPNGELNRAEAAALLYRVLYGDTAPTTPAEAPFSDVPVDQWFAGHVAKLKLIAVVAGNPNNTYEPSESINRAEFLNLAMNAYYYNANVEGKAEVDELRAGAPTENYIDVAAGIWYTANVTAATKLGFVEGSACGENTCFNPGSPITRAEAAAILARMFPE